MNKILLVFSSTAAAVFGVYFKLQSFFFMPVFGLNNGMVPIIAFNYGARKKDRITHTIRLSCIFAFIMMMLGLIVFQIIPDKLLLLFNASEDMISIGSNALRIISWSYLFAGFCIVLSSVFQALGNGVYSLIVSVARQLFVLRRQPGSSRRPSDCMQYGGPSRSRRSYRSFFRSCSSAAFTARKSRPYKKQITQTHFAPGRTRNRRPGAFFQAPPDLRPSPRQNSASVA